MRLLNVGCGNRFHPAWTNVDLVSRHDDVEQYDLRKGLPYRDNEFDAVYHSHVLEHLEPADGESLLRECHRVLKPAGVLRVVVPDLESIVRKYLHQLEQACRGIESAEGPYDWMTYELLDQMVRHQSGGRMGQAMSDKTLPYRPFILKRLGDEIENAESTTDSPATYSAPKAAKHLTREYWRRKLARVRTSAGRRVIRWFFPDLGKRAIDEMLFRETGEIHRWMYDRFSLTRALRRAGFHDVQCCSADASRIENFSAYQLDTRGEITRKPDSLFVEGMKQTAAASRAA